MFWERAMKTLMGIALLGLMLFLIACSTNPRAVPAAPSTAHTKLAHTSLRHLPASTTRATQS